MIAHRKPLLIICVHNEWGWSHDQFNTLKSSIEGVKPDFWEFYNPGTILIYFKDTKKGISRSQELLKSFRDVKSENSNIEKLGIGSAKGEMIFATNVFGKIISSPIGGAANEAIDLAKNSEK